ncbi:MAG: hypothetical protein KKH44_02150, partial [Bacteroidetes bacterium]|nr:hypothetical protein [Bacteroidota bacterium]
MKQFLSFLIIALISACTAQNQQVVKEIKETWKPKQAWKLSDYLGDSPELSLEVETIMATLDDTAKIAQLLMPAIGRYGDEETTIDFLVNHRMISGLLLLNGTKEQCTQWVIKYNSIADTTLNLPFLYSADAEPSLFNRKISNTPVVKKAVE